MSTENTSSATPVVPIVHTLGPWRFDKAESGFPCRFINAEGFDEIAELRGAREFIEQDANARLIATAPELLELLSDARDCMCVIDTEYAKQLIDKIDATIAKATKVV